jgi:hypothetical protein
MIATATAAAIHSKALILPKRAIVSLLYAVELPLLRFADGLDDSYLVTYA